ncbi:FecR family protein, partial [Steroidobacter sp.]|uniref:FecR family protein n=1 Tax=Steroidobacter sp. TaxID=1978227 RepID=UPI001A4D1B93
RWLKQSPAHIAELLRIQQVYKVLRAAKVQNRAPGAPVADAETNVVAITPRSVQSEHLESRPRFESLRGSWKMAAAVAGITVSLLLGFMVKVAWLDRTLETELGEWRTVQLTDGTEVRIGPDTELRLSFGDDRRTVELVRGEALFHVAKDAARPFFVQSEMIGVLAVGTEFRVQRRGGEDVVAVTEGSVALYRDGREAVRGVVSAPPAQVAEVTGGVPLKAGDQVSVTPDTRAKPVAKQKVDPDYESAWADGWVVYENRSIAEVASEFNRRNRVKIVIADPAIAARRLAFFRGNATDPESLVAALAASPDIAIVRKQPNELRVELRP